MKCSKCKKGETSVVDSRDAEEGKAIRRRRECDKCGYRFTTFERSEKSNFVVVKRDGSRERYDRGKVENGIWKACEKRQVTQEQVEKAVDKLEEKWSSMGKEVPSTAIGEGIMKSLKKLDEVAYIRFASVYRQFKDLETFREEVSKLLK
ncbi:transcriptional repressor NrdR [Candidatus Peregrinibacteria bacterium]|jgi:transcriptional repressor NrdR|nr:transcriptional repressor NrdR [Candidatus Peregrinibacteria bacterium]MBT4147703.1 transcriptional repressor NrdR [Candidatus Peregrinibacteria bacterium]MBT4455752.1 transcriptional repressor NrdR [Candidatus Peregrinibacteria bacterium]